MSKGDQAMKHESIASVEHLLRLLGQLDDDAAKASMVALKALKPGTVHVSASESSEAVASILDTYRFRSRKATPDVRGTRRLLEVLQTMPPTDRLRALIADGGNVYVVCFVDMQVQAPYAVLLKEKPSGTVES